MRVWRTAALLALACFACESRPEVSGKTPLAALGRGSVYRSSTGTLAGYDAASRVLTLSAVGAESRYWVAEDARVWLGSRHLPLARLGSHVGAEVTLAFGEAEDGVRTTHTIRLREGRPR